MLRYDFCSIIYCMLFGEFTFMGSEVLSTISVFLAFTLQLGIIKVHAGMQRALKIVGR